MNDAYTLWDFLALSSGPEVEVGESFTGPTPRAICQPQSATYFLFDQSEQSVWPFICREAEKWRGG